MPKFLKKLLKIFAILSVAFIAFLGFVYVKYSNFDGYCEEAGRVLTSEEIKKKVAGEIFEENPYCCLLGPGGWMTNEYDDFLDRFFGYYNYAMYLLYKRKEPLTYDINDPYYEEFITLDECGNYITSYGMTISEKSYNFIINSHKKYSIRKEKNNEKINGN